MNNGWIGVDLDGTLAEYDEWKGVDHIGKPIPKMVERVKTWLAAGKNVRIFTARISEPFAHHPIIKWCIEHIGQEIPITNKTDFNMIELWDDRCVQMIPNTGIQLRDYIRNRSHLEPYLKDHEAFLGEKH
jgi:hypothetical protein